MVMIMITPMIMFASMMMMMFAMMVMMIVNDYPQRKSRSSQRCKCSYYGPTHLFNYELSSSPPPSNEDEDDEHDD